jgi:hypothetical protein
MALPTSQVSEAILWDFAQSRLRAPGAIPRRSNCRFLRSLRSVGMTVLNFEFALPPIEVELGAPPFVRARAEAVMGGGRGWIHYRLPLASGGGWSEEQCCQSATAGEATGSETS